MSIIDKIQAYFTVLFCVIVLIKVYKNISIKNYKILNLKSIIICLLYSMGQIYLATTQYTVIKLFINFIFRMFLYYLIFNEKFKITLIKTICIYTIEISAEISFSGILVTIPFENIIIFDQSTTYIKNLFSMLVSLIILLISAMKKTQKLLKRFVYNIINSKIKFISMLIIILYVFVVILLTNFIFNVNAVNYLINLLFLFITFSFTIGLMLTYNKAVQSAEREKALLQFIAKYEYLLDKEKINHHEMLNNLLILNSFKNKNSKSYNKTLKNLILQYGKGTNKSYNIRKLPSGIKGILYYKIVDIDKHKINFTFHCDSKLNQFLENTNNKNYLKFCQLIGIFLDNAIEAARVTKEKILVFDVYLEGKNLVICIENSVNSNVNMSRITEKNFSTKKKHYGLGLYIAHKIRHQTKGIDFSQDLNNNIFTTILKIKI